MSRNITIHDAKELISRKILINRITSEYLKKQNARAEISIKLQNLDITNNEEKLQLVDELEKLFEQQLREFDAERQMSCMEIYATLNSLQRPSDEYFKLFKKMQKLDSEIGSLAEKIEYLESTIPKEQLVTQYEVKPKPKPVTITQSCGQEAGNPPI